VIVPVKMRFCGIGVTIEGSGEDAVPGMQVKGDGSGEDAVLRIWCEQ